MPDLLAHWAVFDDARRLAAHDCQVEPLFNAILDQQRDVACLGAITRFGKRWMPHLLIQAHEQNDAAKTDKRLQQKIRCALGGILHFPAEQVFKPMMSRLAQVDWNSTHHLMQGRSADSTTTSVIGEGWTHCQNTTSTARDSRRVMSFSSLPHAPAVQQAGHIAKEMRATIPM